MVRFSWSTASSILKEKAYHVEWEDIENPDSPAAKNTAITSFFQPYAATADGKLKSSKTKHKFFTERCLKSCTEF